VKEIANEFRELARKTSIPTPAIDNLYKYIDPDVPPIKDGSSEIPLKRKILKVSKLSGDRTITEQNSGKLFIKGTEGAIPNP